MKLENDGKIEIKEKLKIKLEEINYRIDEIKAEFKVIKSRTCKRILIFEYFNCQTFNIKNVVLIFFVVF